MGGKRRIKAQQLSEDELLQKLRVLVTEVDNGTILRDERRWALARFAEYIKALDESLSNGGFLPMDWRVL